MEVASSPDSVDVQNFQFKLRRRIQAFSSTNKTPFIPLNLVVAASRFGLLFVGSPDKTLHVFPLKNLVEEEGLKCLRKVIPLQAIPVHLSVNCTHEIVCVVVIKFETPVALMYNTKSFASQSPDIIREIRLTPSSGVQLCRLLWNPCQPEALAVCTSDGALSVYTCKQNSFDAQTKTANARCLSWSPKGKQIVTGNADGSLSQYKPDLTLVKNIPPPQLFGTNVAQAIAIHWISNYQFSVVYCNLSDPDSRPCLAIVNTPKAGTTVCINYEDICYGMGGARPPQYYLTHIPTWGVILASSANSMELGVLGTVDQMNWQQWIQMDEARAELPLTEDKQENYPIGISLDDAALYQVPCVVLNHGSIEPQGFGESVSGVWWRARPPTYMVRGDTPRLSIIVAGDHAAVELANTSQDGDGEALSHMPMVHILSHTGTLVSYIAMNLSKTAPPICCPPDCVTIPPQTMIMNIEPSTSIPEPAPVIAPASQPTQDISFVISQNTITSTPTVPKLNTPFSINKPIVTNLFGVTKEQTVQDRAPVPLSAAVRSPMVESKPPTVPSPQSFSISNTFGATPQAQPFANIVKPTANFIKPSVPRENAVEIPQQKPPPAEQALKQGIPQRQEDEGKTYETLISSASTDTIKAMLLKEVNDFQLELYDLLQRCQKVATEIGTSSEMKEISSVLLQCDREPIEKVWSNQDVKQQATMLKHNLIKTCKILAEARMQPESLEIEQLAQLDPVSANRMASIKQTLYYIETQLKQINNVLDEQWETFQDQCKKKVNALRGIREGDSMKMPTLDMVYRPLVNHQEILARHQGTVKALTKCKESFKNDTIINNTTGKSLLSKKKSKSEPLSTLVKSLLNLSLQPDDILDVKNKALYNREAKFTVKKQNALRDMLLNHRTTRIKSVKVEPPNRLQAYYEWKLQQENDSAEKAKTAVINSQNIKSDIQPPATKPTSISHNTQYSNINLKPLSVAVVNTSMSSKQPPVVNNHPLNNLNKFVSNLSDPNQKVNSASPIPSVPDISKTQEVQPTSTQQTIFNQNSEIKNIFNSSNYGNVSITAVAKPSSVASKNTDSTNNSTANIIQKTDSNSFMGQTICSPIPKSTTSVFNSTPSQIPIGTFAVSSIFGETKTTSLFSLPKPISTTPNTLPTTAQPIKASTAFTPSTFKTPSESPIASSPPPVTNTFPSSVRPPTNSKPVQKTENKESINPTPLSEPVQKTLEFGSLSITKITSPSQQESIAPTITSTSSSTKPSQSPLPTQSIFDSPPTATVSTPVVVSETPIAQLTPSSITDVTAATSSISNTSNSAPLGSFFGQSSSTTTLPFGTQTKPTTSVFSTPTNTTSTFGTVPQSPSTATSLFANANASIGSPTGAMFDALSVTTSTGPSSIFGSPAVTVTTCASSLFGSANAAVPTTVTSLFGSTSISTTSAGTPFGSTPAASGGSIFGGSSVFGGQSTFGQSGGSVFGGGNSAFGQPQPSVFGGGNSFGGFGSSSTATNVFGQSAGGSGAFSSVASTGGANVFGNTAAAKSPTFGAPAVSSPTSPQQSSIFGSPTASGTVFGGSPTFGSKPVWGAGFGSSPTGTGGFGSFSGSGDQQNIAQTGFGSPSAFSKPPGTFGASPTFGSTSGFGSPPAFGGSPSFGSPNKMFGSPVADPGFGAANQQSSTFENLATQSTITFGNLAQQSPQSQPAAPVFQGSPSFSMWR